ncbi:MAG: phosphate-binding protein [Chlorobiaceae bacterium]|nr:phosphate-binding protein [Chlorobiaceae bacterium]NTV26821.1 phosphate-binding protein [Chlorobiaceae bacterium]
MNQKVRYILISVLLAAGLVVPVWLWMRPSPSDQKNSRLIPSRTPTRGAASVAVDKSLISVIELQAGTFTDHYPEAKVSLKPEPSGRTLLRLIDRVTGGAVIDGALTREEDSVITSLNRPLKRQPIARNGLVFIVNRENPIRSISVELLKGIFSGELNDWSQAGGKPGSIVTCVDGSDFRTQAMLSSLLFGRARRLSASASEDTGALIDRVAGDERAAAVVTMTQYGLILHSPQGRYIKALPLSKTGQDSPVMASPSTVYSGAYPLVSIVYYLYDPFDATATGFGAWLSKEGQKYFERGDMAPYNQTVRTIILK